MYNTKSETANFSKNPLDSDLCNVMSKILNIPSKDIEKHIHLFRKIHQHTLNSLYYLGKLKNDQDKISALYSLEFVCNFHERVDEYLTGNKLKEYRVFCKDMREVEDKN